MRHYLSMSSTLSMVRNGRVDWADVSDPESRFVFGCTRDYVLGDPARVPHEITWAVRGGPVAEEDGRVAAADLSDEARDLWAGFAAIVSQADADGRIWWGLGRGDDREVNAFVALGPLEQNYPAAADRLRADGHEVIWH